MYRAAGRCKYYNVVVYLHFWGGSSRAVSIFASPFPSNTFESATTVFSESLHPYCNSRVYERIFVAVYPHKPVVYVRPRNATAQVGQTVVFECNVLSDSQPHIQWLKHYSVNSSYQRDDGEPYVNVVHVRILRLLYC